MNYDKIKNKITTDLGLHNVYMQNKLLKMSTNDNIVDYLNKYVKFLFFMMIIYFYDD